jgi:hypothetical protein
VRKPSKSIAKSLIDWRAPGRGEEQITVGELRPGGPSMIVPGEGGVVPSPGRQPERSAGGAHADVMRRFGGLGR